MSIGSTIKYYRKQNKMSQKNLGDALEISSKTISSWEINRTEPNMGMVEKMSIIFGCSKSDLLGEIELKKDDRFYKVSAAASRQKRIDRLPGEAIEELDRYIDYLESRYLS